MKPTMRALTSSCWDKGPDVQTPSWALQPGALACRLQRSDRGFPSRREGHKPGFEVRPKFAVACLGFVGVRGSELVGAIDTGGGLPRQAFS